MENFKYCNSLTQWSRFKTREIKIGCIPLGGDNPVRIQSMTTTDTMDTEATVNQTIRLAEAGCEYVRITAPSIKEAKNLAAIKKSLKEKGYDVPLIADIHFTPNAAEEAARIIEKVRVNPGNYADKKKFQIIEYNDKEYEAELERIYDRFSPLVKLCKEYGTAMRIGTNHGSLSDRIMSRYGDTPLGMVESAMEFLYICRDHNYHDIVLSMKASNTQVMVQAYRLLVNRMIMEDMDYPLHLGVTEAGDGEDGRIKSAVGIGALMEDGLGDTIRVSLTEEPEHEIPVAKRLVEKYHTRSGHKKITPVSSWLKNPFEFSRRESIEVAGIGSGNLPKVFASVDNNEKITRELLTEFGYIYSPDIDKWSMKDQAADLFYAGSLPIEFDPPGGLKILHDYDYWKEQDDKTASFPFFTPAEYSNAKTKSFLLNFITIDIEALENEKHLIPFNDPSVVFVLVTNNDHGMAEQRRAFYFMEEKGVKNPVIIRRSYISMDKEDFVLRSAADTGALFIDGFGDGVWLDYPDADLKNRTSFAILQAVRARISKTEYIACPSCGRTLFDLVEVTDKIRKRTSHLKGVKIGIMGCIVNGPGEMADADYGYVGSGPGRITLYRGKEVVKKNISSEIAVDSLIALIREDGNWVEPGSD